MSLYDIPGMNGYKTAISGYGLLFVGIGGLFTAVGNCLQHLELSVCYADVTGAWQSVLAALLGLGILGVGHKIEKAQQ